MLTLVEQLAVARRHVSRYARAPRTIRKYLSARRKGLVGDTLAQFDRFLDVVLPPPVVRALAAVRPEPVVGVVAGVAEFDSATAAELVVELYRASVAEVRRRASSRPPDVPSPAELIMATAAVAPVLEAWEAEAARWTADADWEFRRAILAAGAPAIRAATLPPSLANCSPRRRRAVSQVQRELNSYIAGLRSRRVGTRLIARRAETDEVFGRLLRAAGCDPSDVAAVRRAVDTGLKWVRKHPGETATPSARV